MRLRPRAIVPILAFVLVLGAYAFYASCGTFDFPRVTWDRAYDKPGEGYYATLAEGFRRGQLNVAREADPRLATLHDPYDPQVRDFYGVPFMWDASYFRGKFYLYFSPVPVLVFYLPYRILRGGYPPDPLAAAFFAAWAFAMSAATLRRAFTGRRLYVPFTIWILLLGLGCLVPLMLIYVRVYEIALIASSAMTATWAYALVRFNETGSIRQAFWLGFWLAVAIVTRPTVAVLLLVTAIALVAQWGAAAPGGAAPARAPVPYRKWATLLACLIPLAFFAIAVMSYNYARFRSPLEFGMKYQLTSMVMRDIKPCSLCTIPEAFRFLNNMVHYVGWATPIRSFFPYVELPYMSLDGRVTFASVPEPMLGLAPVNPLILVGTLLGFLLLFRRGVKLDRTARGGVLVLGAAWLILFGLATCAFIIWRYSSDFAMLMTLGAILTIEAGFAWLDEIGIALWPLRIAAIVLAFYSILIGVFLGFTGPQNSFERANPALYQKLRENLSVKP